MKRVHAKVYGFVQGVGFRNFVRKHAKDLGLKGWVRNNLDGTVQAVFEGDEGSISTILEKCKSGPTNSWVEKVETNEEELKNEFEDFSILR